MSDVPPTWTGALPTLHGDLVDVREVTDADAPTLFEMLSDPTVAAQMSPPPPTVEAFRGFIRWAQRQRAGGEGICFGIVPRGLQSAVGIIQLRPQDPSWVTADWGFALGAAFWSTGVFVDAADLVVGYAFGVMGVHRLEARAVTRNERGNGALRKLGAAPEGALAQSFPTQGRYDPQFLWGLLPEDWRQRSMTRPPFSSQDAQAKINAAIAATMFRVEGQPRRTEAPSDSPSPYPFFIRER